MHNASGQPCWPSAKAIALLGLLSLPAACGGDTTPAHDATSAPDVTDVRDTSDVAVPTSSFALGVEYTEHGLGPIYGDAGVVWTKTHLEEFAWGAIEPAPPTITADGAVHDYRWDCSDDTVRTWQAAGVTHIQSYLVPDSLWGASKVETILGKQVATDTMPRPELLDDYARWVGALVERYDHDGNADMDGLVAPIRHWVIGGEWTGFWPSGDADDYLALLEVTRAAILAADPEARIGLIPFLLVDVFEGNAPSDADIAARLADPPPSWRKSTAGMMKLLDRPELFDYVDVHSLGDYTEIPPTLRWFRAQMAARGYDRPIWFDDAFPIGYLAHWHVTPNAGLPAWHPVSEAQYEDVLALLVAVAKLAEPAYTPALRWIRAEVASGLVKKVVVAAGEGAAAIHIGNTEDWMTDREPGLRHATVNIIGAAAMMGLVDVSHAGGYAPCAQRVAGTPRPGWHNLARLARELGAMTSASRVADLPAGVWAYRFARPEGELLVAWHEDDVLQLPGEEEVAFMVTLPWSAGDQVAVSRAVTDAGATDPVVERVPVSDGGVTLSLTSVPVFVEP